MLKFDRPTLVTITAPTASGKNYLRDLIEKNLGWTRIVSTTTRAMRVGEVHGEDYYFISKDESEHLEASDAFAELITFRGTRYGVTRVEMNGKMNQDAPPMVILEPQGLAIYKQMCMKEGWDVFSIYIYAPEALRLERLIDRTSADIHSVSTQLAQMVLDQNQITPPTEKMTFSLPTAQFEAIVKVHTDRVLSLTNGERTWSNQSGWDAIVPGDDAAKAIEMIQQGVRCKNRKNQTPQMYDHYAAK